MIEIIWNHSVICWTSAAIGLNLVERAPNSGDCGICCTRWQIIEQENAGQRARSSFHDLFSKTNLHRKVESPSVHVTSVGRTWRRRRSVGLSTSTGCWWKDPPQWRKHPLFLKKKSVIRLPVVAMELSYIVIYHISNEKVKKQLRYQNVKDEATEAQTRPPSSCHKKTGWSVKLCIRVRS